MNPPSRSRSPLLLPVSITCNFALSAFIVLRPAQPPSQPVAQDHPSATPVPAPVRPGAAPASFHWSQLETDDFNTYVARLRDVGCPEPTIRDIVRSELHEIYAEKQERARRALSQWTSGGGSETGASLKQKLAALAQEEADATADILRTDAERAAINAQMTAVRQAGAAESANHLAELKQLVRIPLAMRDFYKTTGDSGHSSPKASPPPPALTESQQVGVAIVQEQFVKDMGQGTFLPSDPVYVEKWIHAQVSADQLLMSQIGFDAWSNMQTTAVQEEQREADCKAARQITETPSR
jgi:hypothetical protein